MAGKTAKNSFNRDARQSFGSLMAEALRDLIEGLTCWRLWLALAWEDIRLNYHRTLLGVFWIAISFGFFVLVKVIIFKPLVGNLGGGDTFGLYVALGFWIWQYIVLTTSSATAVFLSAENFIKNDSIPLAVFVYENVARGLFNLSISGLVVVALLAWYRPPLTPWLFLSLAAIPVYVLNAVWVTIFLGALTIRYRDVGQLISTVMRVMFFLTPIFWLPATMGSLMDYLWWNPFAHFVWIFRSPILDGDPAIGSWLFVGAVTLIGWALAFFTFTIARRRITLWF